MQYICNIKQYIKQYICNINNNRLCKEWEKIDSCSIVNFLQKKILLENERFSREVLVTSGWRNYHLTNFKMLNCFFNCFGCIAGNRIMPILLYIFVRKKFLIFKVDGTFKVEILNNKNVLKALDIFDTVFALSKKAFIHPNSFFPWEN